MPRLLFLLLLAAATLPLAAQNIGDTDKQVRAALGNPSMQRSSAAGDIWVYSGGLRLTLVNGVVTAIAGRPGPAATAAPAAKPDYVTTSVREPPASVAVERSTAPRPQNAQPLRPDPETGKSAAALTAVVAIGGLVAFVCNILILIAAFKTGIWWGLGSLFVPFVSLVFVITHWQDTRKPFLVSLGAAAAIVIAAMSTASSLLAQCPG